MFAVKVHVFTQDRTHDSTGLSTTPCSFPGVNASGYSRDIRLLRSANALSIWGGWPHRTVQIMVILYKGASDPITKKAEKSSPWRHSLKGFFSAKAPHLEIFHANHACFFLIGCTPGCIFKKRLLSNAVS